MDTVTAFHEIKGARKYRRRTADEKRQIVEETLSSGRSVAETARSYEVNESGVRLHRFGFELDDGTALPLREFISLRTARVIVANLEDGNAFIKMLQAIVSATPDEFDSLIGKVFPDHFNERPKRSRPMPGPNSEGPKPRGKSRPRRAPARVMRLNRCRWPSSPNWTCWREAAYQDAQATFEQIRDGS